MNTQTDTTDTILSLPNELLVAIAAADQEDRVADLYSSHWQTRSRTFKSEWTLSHVSNRFRDVIVGAPALWTLPEADLNKTGSMEILKLYLERSRPCEVSATLRESQARFFRDDDFLLTQINELVLHWGAQLLDAFRDEVAPHLQYLEIVYVIDKETVSDEPEDAVAMFSSGAPRMSFLKLVRIELQFTATPWTASLTHLELHAYPGNNTDLAALTAQCP
ncbi:hypothetical protein K438DRAFT_1804670, partial [Mycena galopus ATCC 62051]